MRMRRAAFTTVELVIGMAAAAILATVVGAVLYHGHLMWHRAARAAELHRDGSLAMAMVGRAIRAASPSQVGAQAGSLTVTGTNQTLRFYVSGDRLLYNAATAETNDDVAAVQAGLQSFSATLNGSVVAVVLVLDNGDEHIRIDGAAACRN